MKIRKAIQLVLLSALVSTSFLGVGVQNTKAETVYDKNTSFSLKYNSNSELDLYAGETLISRRDSGNYSFGKGRDFIYGTYGVFYYNCGDKASNQTDQQLLDSTAQTISSQMTSGVKSLGWLRTRVEMETPINQATSYAYAIDYYYDSIDLGESKRTTAGSTLNKGFTIKNELQTSISNLDSYKMPLVTKIKVFVGDSLVATLSSGETYKLDAQRSVTKVILDDKDDDGNFNCYSIYLSGKATTKKTVQTGQREDTVIFGVFIVTGIILLTMLISFIYKHKKMS